MTSATRRWQYARIDPTLDTATVPWSARLLFGVAGRGAHAGGILNACQCMQNVCKMHANVSHGGPPRAQGAKSFPSEGKRRPPRTPNATPTPRAPLVGSEHFHMICLQFACNLHAICMQFTCSLHAICMQFECNLHAPCMHLACI